MTVRDSFNNILRMIFRALEWFFEHVGTFLYHEMLKRNTIGPMQKIIREPNKAVQQSYVREWAHTKSNEYSYIQLAGGFVFTTAASCLQWPGVQNGHWSATALFYASILLALVAVVTGSQQMLLMPTEKRQYARDNAQRSRSLPEQMLPEPPTGSIDDLDESEREYLQTLADRFSNAAHEDRPNTLQVFALQVPFMLLAGSVVAFLAALCAVVFAPLARQPVWDDSAKIAVIFGLADVFCVVVFFPTSYLMHGLFSLQRGSLSWAGSRLARIKA